MSRPMLYCIIKLSIISVIAGVAFALAVIGGVL